MESETIDGQRLAIAVNSLQQTVTSLGERVETLEQLLAEATRNVAVPAGDELLADGFSEELLLTIAAAIAAYLGVKPRIRQIRVLGSASWAQQGRATIQASHAVTVHHG